MNKENSMQTKLNSGLYISRMIMSKNPAEFSRHFTHYMAFLNSRNQWAAQKCLEGIRQMNTPKIMDALRTCVA